MSIAKRFAELATRRFAKVEPDTPEYTVACERIIAQMNKGLTVIVTANPEISDEDAYAELDRHYKRQELTDAIREAIDEDYSRSMKDD